MEKLLGLIPGITWGERNKLCWPLCTVTSTRSTNKQSAKDNGWLRNSSSLANAFTESSDHRGVLLVLDSSSGKTLGPPGFHMYLGSLSQPPCRKPHGWTLRKQGVFFLSGRLSGQGEGQGSLLGGHLWKVNYSVCSGEKYLVYLLNRLQHREKTFRDYWYWETEQVRASVGE